jgi:hypothetical protein
MIRQAPTGLDTDEWVEIAPEGKIWHLIKIKLNLPV